MVLNQKVTGKTSALPIGILLGVVVCVMLTLLGTAVVAWMLHAEVLTEEMVGYAAMIILLIASAVGAWISTAKTKRLRVQVCMLTGGGYYLTLLSVTALFFGGQYQGMGVTAVMVLIGCGTVALLGLKDRNRKRGRAPKRAYS